MPVERKVMAEYKVKWFASEMQGAPSLGDTAEGALAALLKAVLVTGFGTLTINALAFDTAKGWAVAQCCSLKRSRIAIYRKTGL